MFISGVLISKYSFEYFWKDCLSFYNRRFARFYLLYAISIILLYIMGYNSIFGRFSIVTSLTMTSTFLLPQRRTLWFFSMIASFYIFTPFILIKTPKSFLYSFITIYGGSIFLMLMSSHRQEPCTVPSANGLHQTDDITRQSLHPQVCQVQAGIALPVW